MPKEGYPLPITVNPPRTCVSISLPDDPNHLAAFWGQIAELGHAWMWAKDDAKTGREVARVWLEVFNDVLTSCAPLYDLRQTGILIELQDSEGGAWSTLYDPSAYVVLKAPNGTYPNTVNAPAGIRGLWLRQAGGEYAFVAEQQGNDGAGALIALDTGANTSPVLMLERPTTNGDYLQVRVNGLWQTAINRYGQINAIVYAANLPQANSNTLGAIIYLSGSANPSSFPDGAYIGSFIISGGTPVYYWAKFKGADGAPGATGSDGLPALMSIGSVTPVLPKDNPNVTITPGANNSYALGFYLPRAVNFGKLNDVVRNPNQSPTVALTTDTNGDKLLQFGLPRMFTLDMYPVTVIAPSATASAYIDTDANGDKKFGFSVNRGQKIVEMTASQLPSTSQPTVNTTTDANGDLKVALGIPAGAAASGGGSLDTVLPALGESKIYSMIVLADTITNLPFRVPADSTIDQITGAGYWSVFDNNNVHVVGLAGTVEDGFPTGDMRMGTKSAQISGNFTYEELTASRYFVADTWVSFAQHRQFPQEYGGGWILVTYRLTRGGAVQIIGVYDFEASDQGWHAVTQQEAASIGFGNEWGGQWRSDGSIGNGWRPTANPAEGWNCTIMSPLATATFTLTGVQFYYDNLPSTGLLYAWVYHDNSGWHFMNNFSVTAASGSPSQTGLNFTNVDRVALVTTSYQHGGTTDWRIRKAVITGTT